MDNRIPNGTKFYTPYGTIGVVVNYDDVSEMYITKDNYGNLRYYDAFIILRNKIDKNMC